ncbi:hypothetical protein [Paenibacillus sp. Soil724D2]|uniref:hypothetical protein n=1 Tax=Paenibacillus sp. (strain Soil724D2) TaxID=1736392 RepID=UPI00071328AE|nr:hypothetical protein [Paenibacillus sp. Soil724D2]KRE33289.1 hypothetical protein ASG85_13495 [Paenibacillus sp. Soil724D2]
MDDDMILDDGFDLPVDDASDEITHEPSDFESEQASVEEPTSEPTTPVEETKEDTPQQRMLKLKVDRGEREVPEEEAILLAQKGLNYERAVERAKQEARDTYIAEQGYTWNDKPITNEAEYKQALAEQDLMKKYQDKDLPPEVIQELIESRRDREERQQEKQAKEEEAKQQKSYDDFFQYFESVNERRFDPKTDTLPQEVIEAANNGQPLKYAYMEHFTKQLRNSLKVSKQNETNQKKAPVGSVSAYGNNSKEPSDPFLEGFNSD